jgi:hypothetical protein
LEVFKFFNLSKVGQNLKSIISIVSILTTLTAGGGAVYASDSATPGDFLYGLDQMVENIQRVVTTDPVAQAELELAIMDERVLELQTLTDEQNSEAIAESLSDIEAQQTRLQTSLQTMDQLRVENKIQTQEQLKVLEQLQVKVQEHEAAMYEMQTKLQSSGDDANAEALKQFQSKYSDETIKKVQEFEETTGTMLNESTNEQNSGEDTQIQNQIQNEVDNSDSNGADNNNQNAPTNQSGNK